MSSHLSIELADLQLAEAEGILDVLDIIIELDEADRRRLQPAIVTLLHVLWERLRQASKDLEKAR